MNEGTSEVLLRRLFPLCRSITGEGVRETLRIINEYAEFRIEEYPSGTMVHDWTIPDEWRVREAYIEDSAGNRVVDFQENNLHLMSYSRPLRATLSFDDLAPHLHSLPDHPSLIPYRTSYYQDDWGFCLSQDQLNGLDRNGDYRVVVDTDLKPGSLTLAHAVLAGTSGKEFLFSTYCCHPSMANDNVSGMVGAVLLYRALRDRRRRHGYRFVIAPETIGAITYLAHHGAELANVAGGFVLSCMAGPDPLGYKETFHGDHLIDRSTRLAFRDAGLDFIPYPFIPNGSDERQYSSPGYRIPMGTITKSKYYEYPFYHTSGDDLDFVSPDNLEKTCRVYLSVIDMLEENAVFVSRSPHGEPHLGKRGLHPAVGGTYGQTASSDHEETDVIAWIMFLADGSSDLIAMAERSGVPFHRLARTARRLTEGGLLEEITEIQ